MPASKYKKFGGEKKFKRCVEHVSEHNLIALGEGGKQVNPYAVCTVALERAVKKTKRKCGRRGKRGKKRARS